MALQFTRQQLVGGASYHPKTRIGNWNEDIELKEWDIAENIHKKERGNLLSTKMAAIYQRSMATVQPSEPIPAGTPIRYGEHITITSCSGTGKLSMDISDSVSDWAVSTCVTSNTCVRNVFRIVPADGDLNSSAIGTELRLGDRFLLVSNEDIQRDETGTMGPMRYLACQAKGFEQLGRLSGESPVFMSTEKTSKTMWHFESSLDGEYGFLETKRKGAVTYEDKKLVIRNTMTNIMLTTHKSFNYQGKISGETEHEVYGSKLGRKIQVNQTWKVMQL